MNNYTLQYLSGSEKKLYSSFYTVITSKKEMIKVSPMQNISSALNILSRCLLDTPMALGYRSELNYETRLLEQALYVGKLPLNQIQLRQMETELIRKVDAILLSSEFTALGTVAEQLKFLYSYIQRNTVYDHDEIANRTNPLAHTAYGAIVSGRSVCDGNAKAMVLFCERLGIPCIGVDGVLDGGFHSWIMVKCGDKWFHCDPTYTYTIDGTPDYSHWLQSDDEVMPSHQWERSAYPACNDKFSGASGCQQPPQAKTNSASFIVRYVTESAEECVSIQENDEFEGAVKIRSMTEYQSALREAFEKGEKSVKFSFERGSVAFKEETVLRLFERISDEYIADEMEYTYKIDEKRLKLIIEWE